MIQKQTKVIHARIHIKTYELLLNHCKLKNISINTFLNNFLNKKFNVKIINQKIRVGDKNNR